jgi:ParB family transcriptional regulator, chromosome partitioning protein
MDRRPALGKGLSALIPDSIEGGSSTAVDIDRLTPNELQPRGHIDPESLADLSRSIASNGIIQPIVVRKVGDRFHIIAGERRWRAAKMAGLREVPVVVRDIAPGEDRSLLEVALIENIQREDLNPIEKALAYRRLADQFEMSQEAVATAVGKDRVTITNTVRLLKLPEDVRADVASGVLSMGHARALLALAEESEQRRIAREVVARGLSVRETEALVRKNGEQPAPTKPPSVDVHTRAAEDRLRLVLGTRVRIVRRGTRGRIEVDFGSEEELIRIYEQLTERH